MFFLLSLLRRIVITITLIVSYSAFYSPRLDYYTSAAVRNMGQQISGGLFCGQVCAVRGCLWPDEIYTFRMCIWSKTILFIIVSAWLLGLAAVLEMFGGCFGRIGYGLFGLVVRIFAFLVVR